MAFTKREEANIRAAHTRGAQTRSAMVDMGFRSMEVTEDGYGIVWERMIMPNGVSCVLVSTQHWHDVFVPAADGNSISETLSALRIAAGLR